MSDTRVGNLHIIATEHGGDVRFEWPGPAAGTPWSAVRALNLAADRYFYTTSEAESRINYTAKGRDEERAKAARVAILEIAKQDTTAFQALEGQRRDVAERFKSAEREAVTSYETSPAQVHVDLAVIAAVTQPARLNFAQEVFNTREIRRLEDKDLALALVRLPYSVTRVPPEHRDALRTALVGDLRPELVEELELVLAQMSALSANSHARIRAIVAHAGIPYSTLHGWSEKAWRLFHTIPGQVSDVPQLVPASQNAAALAGTAVAGLPAEMAPIAFEQQATT